MKRYKNTLFIESLMQRFMRYCNNGKEALHYHIAVELDMVVGIALQCVLCNGFLTLCNETFNNSIEPLCSREKGMLDFYLGTLSKGAS